MGEVFIFRSEQSVGLFALSRDMTGSNLPGAYGPWQASSRQAMQGPFSNAKSGYSELVIFAIETRGFYLSRSDGLAW
jgi:hypothetical protein